MPIPRVIHQLWKDAEIPERYAPLCATWDRLNPGWERRLWTDQDLARLVETHYPALAPIYWGYAENINRADLGRYLVLRSFGGVYADLDCECLRPLEPLLDGAELAIGLEPEAHHKNPIIADSGLDHVLCASFIGSAPGHPYWDALLDQVRTAAEAEKVLERTGPFLLTRVYDAFDDKTSVTLLPAEQVYPLTQEDCWTGRAHDIESWEQATRQAFVVHYWDGTWFRIAPTPRGLPWSVPAAINNRPPEPRAQEPHPAIACLMRSSGQLERARGAIDDFLRQTYVNRTLLVGAEAPEPGLVRHVAGLAGVRLVQASGGVQGLARLAAESDAALACVWDEDCAHDPRRLEMQQELRRATRAEADLMRRRVMWRPSDGRIGVSPARPLASALLAPRAALAALAERAADEAALVTGFDASLRLASFDLPRLMIQVDDGADPASAATFEADWAAASNRMAAERTAAVVTELEKRIPLADRAQRRTPARPRPAAPPRVLILTPVKNARPHLRTYFTLLNRLDPAAARMSIGFLESDSSDGSYDTLVAASTGLHRMFERVTLLRQDYGFHPAGARYARDIQRRRREILARSRNRLLTGALRDEDWVLWLDADLQDYPPDLVGRMLAAGRDIVTPYCVKTDGTPFDLNTFCFSPQSGGRDDPRHIHDGLFQPPRGHGRVYLDAFQDRDLVRVDSVGGTALLIRADHHREGLSFPPYSYKGYIETEGLAMMASDMGQACWAMPRLRITHADN